MNRVKVKVLLCLLFPSFILDRRPTAFCIFLLQIVAVGGEQEDEENQGDVNRRPSKHSIMQGLHQQQQQLASLLSVALPKKDASPSTSKPAENEESARLSAITSLHRAILYPPNSLLVAHSASFLSQGISQLLPDK